MNGQKNLKNKNHKVHLLGICGISMSALALKLYDLGFKISGSDRHLEQPTYKILSNRNLPINRQGDLEQSETVVYSSAISPTDKGLVYAKKSGKNLISRAELLRLISENYPTFIGVAGTHGKTTCTSLLAHIFYSANLPFDAHIGGLDKKFGNYYSGGNQIFLSELCEYKKNLSCYSPHFGIVLNVDSDHLESYGSIKAIGKEFEDFANRSRVCVYNDQVEFKPIKNGVSFSLKNPSAHYFARVEKRDNKISECVVYEHGEPLLRVDMQKFMPYDVGNILPAVALARKLNISNENILSGLNSFNGIARRNEILYKSGNRLIIADYAHHPSQISLAIKGYKQKFGKCNFLFQPHTYSRTRDLFQDFISSFKQVEKLYLFKCYGARENYEYEGCSKRLHKSLPNSAFCGDVSNVESVVNRLIEGDLPIIVLGAGDIYEWITKYVEKQKCH